MTTKLTAALLAFILCAAPAAAVCGMDCATAAASVTEPVSGQPAGSHGHQSGSAHARHHGGQEPTPEEQKQLDPPEGPATHGCHQTLVGDLERLGSSPQACTHLRFEPDPAKVSSVDADALTKQASRVAMGLISPHLCSLLERRAVLRSAASLSGFPTVFISPLRI